mmetsp:Transcript_26852/g.57099  ORF Transcript_26852/g.57099 Transcript_26852/m.57099 type:complete len:227 (+) Transcript_26852:2839-3519(+)
MLHPDGGEVHEPVHRVGKLGNFLLRDHALQDVPLSHDARPRLLDELRLAALGLGAGGRGLVRLGLRGGGNVGLHLGADIGILLRELRRGSIQFDFRFEFVGGRLNGHPRAVKREREQRILPPIPLELRPKHRLRQAERVAQVKVTVAVRVRKRHDELLPPVGGIALEGFLAFPQGLDVELGGTEGVALGGSLGSAGRSDGEVGHFVSGGGGRHGCCCWGHGFVIWS